MDVPTTFFCDTSENKLMWNEPIADQHALLNTASIWGKLFDEDCKISKGKYKMII